MLCKEIHGLISLYFWKPSGWSFISNEILSANFSLILEAYWLLWLRYWYPIGWFFIRRFFIGGSFLSTESLMACLFLELEAYCLVHRWNWKSIGCSFLSTKSLLAGLFLALEAYWLVSPWHWKNSQIYNSWIPWCHSEPSYFTLAGERKERIKVWKHEEAQFGAHHHHHHQLQETMGTKETKTFSQRQRKSGSESYKKGQVCLVWDEILDNIKM